MANSKLFSKLSQRYINSRSKWQTSTIIDEIFDLSDKNYKNTTKINSCMKELKSRGEDAVFEYYEKYIRRVMYGDAAFESINVYYALNEVLKLGNVEKIWKFLNLLQDLQEDHFFKINYEKCSKAIAKSGNVEYNLYWSEYYLDYNAENIKVVLDSKDNKMIIKLITLVSNLTQDEINQAIIVVKKSKDQESKQELKQVLQEKNYKFVKQL